MSPLALAPTRVREPRNRGVACTRCRTSTWEVTAVCVRCQHRSGERARVTAPADEGYAVLDLNDRAAVSPIAATVTVDPAEVLAEILAALAEDGSA